MKKSLLIISSVFLSSSVFAENRLLPIEFAKNDKFSFAVYAYAVENYNEIKSNKEFISTSGGVKMSPGSGIGQSFHPTPDQLSAMGFLPLAGGRGDARIFFEPANCHIQKSKSCRMILETVVSGVKQSTSLSEN